MDVKILTLSLILCSFLVCRETTCTQSSASKNTNQVAKPIIKSIKTKCGRIYDCVDFYKQTAFDHPSLNGHSFHPKMKPEYVQRSIKGTKNFHQNATFFKSDVGLEDDGCPKGTVPIQRLSNHDLVQMKRFTKEYASRMKANKVQPQPGSHFAIVQTKSDPSVVKYYGVHGTFNVYSLSIGPSQYSSGEIIIQNGEDRIHVGWTVNPALNKDTDRHLFQYLNAGQSHCFNLLCPGFVLVGPTPIDVKLIGESKRGGEQRGFTLSVSQDAKTGDWWLEFQGRQIGFWPQKIFSGLGSGATYIAVGGEAYGPIDQPLPPMGNGYYPVEDPNLSAYCKNFTVLNVNRQWIDPEDTETYANDDHYGVYDLSKEKHADRLVVYGGTTLWA